jgi:Fur family transcriptional regulator, ferric uptake regulator
MTHYNIDYESKLRAMGHRVTPQRVLILDTICDMGSHTTLGKIYAEVRHIDASIDRSTLYRTLKLFVDLGLVVSADTGDGETYYEIAKPHPHHHLICRLCGAEQEIDHEVIQTMSKQILSRYGFKTDMNHLVLRGVCNSCSLNLNEAATTDEKG